MKEPRVGCCCSDLTWTLYTIWISLYFKGMNERTSLFYSTTLPFEQYLDKHHVFLACSSPIQKTKRLPIFQTPLCRKTMDQTFDLLFFFFFLKSWLFVRSEMDNPPSKFTGITMQCMCIDWYPETKIFMLYAIGNTTRNPKSDWLEW
jgi:hypothetical protein